MLKLLYIILFALYSYAGTVNVAVAANVSYAIDDLIKEFNKTHPNTKIEVTLGGSGKLVAQIRYGAYYHIFMSANMKYPDNLYKHHLAITKPIVYAQGSLAMLSNRKRDFSKKVFLLKDSSITKIAVANPKTAPYGKATKELLENLKIYNDIKSKFIYSESISQTVSYTVTAADIGFIAKSSLYSPKMKQFKKGTNWIDISPSSYTPIAQGIVILNNGKDNDEVKAFYDFILSKKAQKIFKRFGYIF